MDRKDVVRDFTTRGLVPPVGLVTGDCTVKGVRGEARGLVGAVGGFDVIVADPPYGIRERCGGGEGGGAELPALVRFVVCMVEDRRRGYPLLKRGGRLVAFVPTATGEDVRDGVPDDVMLASAGLRLVEMVEQPLSDVLSRWLVVFDSI